MNERVHQYLDGELPLESLNPEERRAAQEHLRILEESLPLLREVSAPDLTGPVMVRIAGRGSGPVPGGISVRRLDPTSGEASGGAPSRPSSGLRWLWEPRLVRVRPVYGVLAAAALLLVVLLPEGDTRFPGWGGAGTGAGPGAPHAEDSLAGDPGATEATTIFVQFRLEAPRASEVRLAGSFTGWAPDYELRETGPGSWSVLVPLPPGIHDYAFVVDGRDWVPDPAAPSVDDGFGGQNSRLALLLSNGGGES